MDGVPDIAYTIGNFLYARSFVDRALACTGKTQHDLEQFATHQPNCKLLDERVLLLDSKSAVERFESEFGRVVRVNSYDDADLTAGIVGVRVGGCPIRCFDSIQWLSQNRTSIGLFVESQMHYGEFARSHRSDFNEETDSAGEARDRNRVRTESHGRNLPSSTSPHLLRAICVVLLEHSEDQMNVRKQSEAREWHGKSGARDSALFFGGAKTCVRQQKQQIFESPRYE